VDYRDWLFAISCEGYSDFFDADYMDEASDILMNDLLVVDIEAVLLKKEPQFFFIERTLKQYKMGNYDIKPLLYPADYR